MKKIVDCLVQPKFPKEVYVYNTNGEGQPPDLNVFTKEEIEDDCLDADEGNDEVGIYQFVRIGKLVTTKTIVE